MKNLLTPARILAVPLLMGCLAIAWAQSLGTPSAEVWIGRPLEMTVPARFNGNGADDECVHADVFFGEQRVKANDVRTSIVGTEQQRRVRIETSALVDEPVVTVAVRAGCRSTVTRNYTLLPEIPSETMLAGIVRQQQLAAVGAVPAAPLRMTTAAGPGPLAAARMPAVRTADARGGEGASPRARTAIASARAFRNEGPRGPRLRLEPIEIEHDAVLRVSNRLAEPAGDASRRATAALLWQAINADPQEILRTNAMLQKLENELLQLRQASSQTRAEMAALRRRLDEAQPWYLSTTMVQVLLLLVLAAAAAAGLFWFRSRRALRNEPWYAAEAAAAQATAEAPPEQAQPVMGVGTARVLAAEVLPVSAVPGTATPVPLPVPVPVAVQPAKVEEEETVDLELPTAAARGEPRRASTGVLRVETLAATIEEVEFLSSLGLAKDAMDVLKAYLQDSSSPAPLAFFELMRLCDQQEDGPALATVRRRYAHAFGVDAPRLEQVSAPLGLESFPELSERITAAWRTPQALEIIGQALFKVPQPGAAVTLQAGRDLICLYDVAMRVQTESAGTADQASEAEAHPLAPWAEAENPHDAHLLAQHAAEAHGGLHFALDVDLGAAPAALPEKEEQPDLTPLLAEMRAAAAREAAARDAARKATEEDAFSAAVASERVPVSRF